MSEAGGANLPEKVNKAKRKPEGESVLQRTFASAPYNATGSRWSASPPQGSGLLQRQCACGQHTIAGGECQECRQKRENVLQRRCACGQPITAGGECKACRQKRESSAFLQRSTRPIPSPMASPTTPEALRSPDQRLGHDFSRI